MEDDAGIMLGALRDAHARLDTLFAPIPPPLQRITSAMAAAGAADPELEAGLDEDEAAGPLADPAGQPAHGLGMGEADMSFHIMEILQKQANTSQNILSAVGVLANSLLDAETVRAETAGQAAVDSTLLNRKLDALVGTVGTHGASLASLLRRTAPWSQQHAVPAVAPPVGGAAPVAAPVVRSLGTAIHHSVLAARQAAAPAPALAAVPALTAVPAPVAAPLAAPRPAAQRVSPPRPPHARVPVAVHAAQLALAQAQLALAQAQAQEAPPLDATSPTVLFAAAPAPFAPAPQPVLQPAPAPRVAALSPLAQLVADNMRTVADTSREVQRLAMIVGQQVNSPGAHFQLRGVPDSFTGDSGGRVNVGTHCYMTGVGSPGMARTERAVGTSIPKLNPPAKFKGLPSDHVESSLFAFEEYFLACGIPESEWHLHGMTLLSDRALEVWTAFARPKRMDGEAVSWGDMVEVLTSTFGRPNEARHARHQLHTCRQTTSVQQFAIHMKSLMAQAGKPFMAEPDLISIFMRGLKPYLLAKCESCPRTGQYWDSFQELIEYAILMDERKGGAPPFFPNRDRGGEQQNLPGKTIYPRPDHHPGPAHKKVRFSPSPQRERGNNFPRPKLFSATHSQATKGSRQTVSGGNGGGGGNGGPRGGRGAGTKRPYPQQQQQLQGPGWQGQPGPWMGNPGNPWQQQQQQQRSRGCTNCGGNDHWTNQCTADMANQRDE